MKVLAPFLMAASLTFSINTIADNRIPWSQFTEPAGSYDALVEWQGMTKLKENSQYYPSAPLGTSDAARQWMGIRKTSGTLLVAAREPAGTSDAAREATRIAKRLQRLVDKGIDRQAYLLDKTQTIRRH
jgi:hypothetical protein